MESCTKALTNIEKKLLAAVFTLGVQVINIKDDLLMSLFNL